MLRLILAGAFLFCGLFIATTFSESAAARSAAQSFFTNEQIETGLRYAFDRRLLYWSGTFLHLAFLTLLVATPLARKITDGCARRASGRWLPTLLLVGGLFFAAQTLLFFPISLIRFHVASAWGMTSQDVGDWLVDYAKHVLVSAVEDFLILVCFYSLLHWFPRRWWAAATLAGALAAPLYATLLPVVVEPIFNDFTPLSQTPWADLEPMVRYLAAKGDVPVEDVLVMNASRQTNHTNAYFTGFGATRRIVLYDTLLKNHGSDEVATIVAHEIGHWRGNHIYKGIALGLAGAMFGFFVLSRILLWAMGRGALALRSPSDPAGLPLILLLIALAGWLFGPVEYAISRAFERQADQAALELAAKPEAFIAAEVKLAITNKSNVAPTALAVWLFANHPTTLERIGMALNWQAARP